MTRKEKFKKAMNTPMPNYIAYPVWALVILFYIGAIFGAEKLVDYIKLSKEERIELKIEKEEIEYMYQNAIGSTVLIDDTEFTVINYKWLTKSYTISNGLSIKKNDLKTFYKFDK